MDNTDLKIIRILEKNGRIKITDLGRQVSLTPPAVTERIRRLEETGVIIGYRVQINPEKLGLHITAFIMVQVSAEKFDAFLAVASKEPRIIECHHIIGRNCIHCKILVKNTEELKDVVNLIKKYGETETAIMLAQIK